MHARQAQRTMKPLEHKRERVQDMVRLIKKKKGKTLDIRAGNAQLSFVAVSHVMPWLCWAPRNDHVYIDKK